MPALKVRNSFQCNFVFEIAFNQGCDWFDFSGACGGCPRESRDTVLGASHNNNSCLYRTLHFTDYFHIHFIFFFQTVL